MTIIIVVVAIVAAGIVIGVVVACVKNPEGTKALTSGIADVATSVSPAGSATKAVGKTTKKPTAPKPKT